MSSVLSLVLLSSDTFSFHSAVAKVGCGVTVCVCGSFFVFSVSCAFRALSLHCPAVAVGRCWVIGLVILLVTRWFETGGSTVSSVLRVVGVTLASVWSCLTSLYWGVSSCRGLKIVSKRFISPVWESFSSVVAVFGCFNFRMLIMSLITAVSLSLSLGNGKGTLSGNHVSVSAVLVPRVSAL